MVLTDIQFSIKIVACHILGLIVSAMSTMSSGTSWTVLFLSWAECSECLLFSGLYTIITFPFLFGLMFGDIGHAILLTIFAGWLVKFEKQYMEQKSTNDIWIIMFGGKQA